MEAKSMTDAEKIAIFNEIQAGLWGVILGTTPANLMQQMMAAQMVRTFEIPGPNGEDPEGA